MKRHQYLRLAALCCATVLLWACGSSSSGTTPTTTSGDTVTISGSIAATGVSANLSKSLGSEKVVAVSGKQCSVFTIEGEELISTESDANGDFSGTVGITILKPATATDATWEEDLFCVCESDEDDSDTGFFGTYARISFDEAANETTVTCGELSVEGGFAMEEVIEELDEGCDIFSGENCRPDELDHDGFHCKFIADLATWEEADASNEGVGGTFGLMRDLIFEAQEAGIDPASIRDTFEDWGDVAQAIRDGELTAAEQEALMASSLLTELGITEDAAETMFDAIDELEAKKHEILAEHVYGDNSSIATAAANETVAEGETTETDPCPQTAEEAAALVSGFMHADDLTDMDRYDDPRVWAQMEDMLDNVEDDDYTKFRGEHGELMHEFLENFEDDYEKFHGDHLYTFMFEIEDDADIDELKDSVDGYFHLIDGGHIGTDAEEDAIDVILGELFADDFDIADVDDVAQQYEQVEEFVGTHGDEHADAFATCDALAHGSDAQQACYEEIFGDEIDFGDEGESGDGPCQPEDPVCEGPGEGEGEGEGEDGPGEHEEDEGGPAI